jgi:prepilin-type N-terminal cleavage/methylation domain-containing protein
MKCRNGLTLVELMVVIFIIGILAAVTLPVLSGRIDQAKWAEAKASSGTIKTAVRAYIATEEPGKTDYSEIDGTLGTNSIDSLLGFPSGALNGTYFNHGDYTISEVNGSVGTCAVTVVSSHAKGPSGTGVAAADGTWTVTGD